MGGNHLQEVVAHEGSMPLEAAPAVESISSCVV